MMKKLLSFVLAIFMLIGTLPVIAMTSAMDNVIQTLVEPTMEYFIVKGFSEGLAAVEKDEKCGFIDETGNIVIPLEYDADRDSHFSEGLALVYKGGQYLNASQRIMKGGKCGFIDKTGKVVIPMEYDGATAFFEGIAAVEKDGKQYLIDKSGNVVVALDTHYSNDSSGSSFNGMGIETFSDGLASVMKDGKYGFIDKMGKEVIPVGEYESVWWPFSEGLTVAGKSIPTGDEDYYKRYGVHSYYKRYGFIDKSSKIIIPFEYDAVSSFSDGLASVMKGSKWGVINKTGEVVVPFEYDGIGTFSEGLASFNKDGKQGYMDKTGKVIISLDYIPSTSFIGETLPPFRDGFAVVCSGDKAKWGIIDKTGKEVIPLEYNYISSFNDGLAVTFKGYTNFYHNYFDGKWGILKSPLTNNTAKGTSDDTPVTSDQPSIVEKGGIKFNDVTESYWAYNDIMSLTDSGALNGYEDGTFRPDNSITHAEMAKIITAAFNLKGNDDSNNETTAYTLKRDIENFSPNEWWSEFALIAVDYYYPGGLSIVYNSDEYVNRRQVAVALVNILNPKYDFSYTTTGYVFPSNWKDILKSEFVDFAENDGWNNDVYIDYVDGFWVNSPKHIYLAKTMGLISGYPDGTFQPLGNITRAEFCAMVNNAY